MEEEIVVAITEITITEIIITEIIVVVTIIIMGIIVVNMIIMATDRETTKTIEVEIVIIEVEKVRSCVLPSSFLHYFCTTTIPPL